MELLVVRSTLVDSRLAYYLPAKYLEDRLNIVAVTRNITDSS